MYYDVTINWPIIVFYVSPVIIATKSSWLTAEGKQHTCNMKINLYNDKMRVVCKINSTVLKRHGQISDTFKNSKYSLSFLFLTRPFLLVIFPTGPHHLYVQF